MLGAAAPWRNARVFSYRPEVFDDTDPLDPGQVAEQAALTADVITTGLRLGASEE